MAEGNTLGKTAELKNIRVTLFDIRCESGVKVVESVMVLRNI